MRPPDALQRPSGRANAAKAQPSPAGVFVAFMVQAAGIHLARITRPGGMVCGRGNGPRLGQR